jgi:hypothetical protein
MKITKIWRRPHGYFGGGILDPLIFPTITTRTGDADIDLIVEIECDTFSSNTQAHLGGQIWEAEICPTITTSSWECNFMLIESDEQETYEDDKGGENPQ